MQNIFENIYDGKTVLVTGSTGFKGSWLCTWLVSVGANVIGYALRPLNEKDNYVISGLAKKITYIDNDIRDYQKLHNVFSKYKPDIVFHLAAQAIVLESYNDPIYTYSTNVMGTVNLFEAIRQTSSVKVAINVTSDKCYENKEW
ncbi:MAG: GDP-mannose 4,6-dehydratase, partial [Calditrichia bacterium]|nr:GDP-mannose 4,6-dehydratase [Calditrichia bacterium]